MNRQRKYIALFLAWIIVLPIFVHSVHVVHHHYYDSKYGLNQGLNIKECCNEEKASSNKCSVYGERSHCFICEYQFSVNEDITFHFFKTSILRINIPYRKPARDLLLPAFVKSKSVRAPPKAIG